MKMLIFSFVFVFANTVYAAEKKVPAAAAEVVTKPATEIKVGVKGMVCAFCAQGIEKKFNAQNEIANVKVSLENKWVILKFKEGKKLSNEKIAEILKDAGYEAEFGK
jgi:copper chaperone CopZ